MSVSSLEIHWRTTCWTTYQLGTWDENDRNNCGKPTEAYLEAYRRWSEGKTGTILLGNIPVHRDHVEAAGNAIIDKNSSWDAVAEFRKVVQVIQSNGSLCIGQLTHAGRQAPEQVQKHPVSASDTQYVVLNTSILIFLKFLFQQSTCHGDDILTCEGDDRGGDSRCYW